MSGMLPRMFFKHFAGTSLVAETDDGALAGFVVAFVSQDDPTAGYIHFVGVDRVAAPVHVDYDGPGEDRVVFSRAL